MKIFHSPEAVASPAPPAPVNSDAHGPYKIARASGRGATEVGRALPESPASDIDRLLGGLAATQGRVAPIAPSPEVSAVTRSIGGPALAPEPAQEDDSVLQELDKLIARLDAEAAQARAAAPFALKLPLKPSR
jgi:hypothetical protein